MNASTTTSTKTLSWLSKPIQLPETQDKVQTLTVFVYTPTRTRVAIGLLEQTWDALTQTRSWKVSATGIPRKKKNANPVLEFTFSTPKALCIRCFSQTLPKSKHTAITWLREALLESIKHDINKEPIYVD
jgi:hypothetical protein